MKEDSNSFEIVKFLFLAIERETMGRRYSSVSVDQLLELTQNISEIIKLTRIPSKK